MPITTLENMKDALRNLNKDYYGNKTFASLYGANYLSGEMQKGTIAQSYNDAMEQAYKSSLAQRSAVQASNIGQGAKKEMLSDLDVALEDAYSQYMANQGQSIASVNEAVTEGASAIDTALTTQAENTLGLKEALENYYADLYTEQLQSPDTNLFTNDVNFSNFLVEIPEENLATTENYIERDGKYYRQKTLAELQAEENWYDEKGNLGTKAQDFYDKMLNYASTYGGATTFGDYLKSKDKDLYKWAMETNQFGWSPDSSIAATNRNLGIVKQTLGLKSTDETYSFIERQGGLSKDELDEVMAPLYNFQKELDKAYNEKSLNTKDFAKAITPMIDEVQTLANQLGLDQNADWVELNNRLEQIKAAAPDKIGNLLGRLAGTIGGSVLTSTAGLAMGGPVMAIIAGALTTIGGVGITMLDYGYDEKQNKELSKQIKELYSGMIAAMIEASKTEQSESK